MLTEYKNKYNHYYVDVQGRHQGEFKAWWDNGQLKKHCFYKDGWFQGEYKWWWDNGRLRQHSFYKDHKDITKEIKALVEDLDNITHKEKMMIKLKFGIDCISKEIKCHN